MKLKFTHQTDPFAAKLAEQTKYDTEAEARAAARTLLKTDCQIVESKEKGYEDTGPFVFYLEHGQMLSRSFVRNWERLVFSGKGCDA